eukprot:353509-Chlamydomonas_euryale.AAC.3
MEERIRRARVLPARSPVIGGCGMLGRAGARARAPCAGRGEILSALGQPTIPGMAGRTPPALNVAARPDFRIFGRQTQHGCRAAVSRFPVGKVRGGKGFVAELVG